jgi:hypothetical protein
MRIKGWMGPRRSDHKVKNVFVRPEQIAEIGNVIPSSSSCVSRHPRGRHRMSLHQAGLLNDSKVFADERGALSR